MLVTQWLDHDNRETRDMDFLGIGTDDQEAIRAIFSEITALDAGDGLVFDIEALAASPMRDEIEYGGIRLKTSAYFERTRIPVTLDIGLGDALGDPGQKIDYPSLLGMEQPYIRSYTMFNWAIDSHFAGCPNTASLACLCLLSRPCRARLWRHARDDLGDAAAEL